MVTQKYFKKYCNVKNSLNQTINYMIELVLDREINLELKVFMVTEVFQYLFRSITLQSNQHFSRVSILNSACARSCNFRTIQWLVEGLQLNIYSPNSTGYTVFHSLAQIGNLELMKYFVNRVILENGQEGVVKIMNQTTQIDGLTPGFLTAYNDRQNILEYFINELGLKSQLAQQKAKNGQNILMMAIQKSNYSLIKYICEQFLPDKLIDINEGNIYGKTVLEQAAKTNRLQIVQYLIANWEADGLSLFQDPEKKKIPNNILDALSRHYNIDIPMIQDNQ
eukprot:403350874